MNNVEGVEGFIREYMKWYQGFLDSLNGFSWKDPASPLFTQRHENGANITKQTPLGLPYEVLGAPLDKLVAVGRGLWEPLKQKENELADKVKSLKDEYKINGSPLVLVTGRYACEHDGKFIAFPQYDVFTGEIQLRIWEQTILDIGLKFERAPLFPGLEASDGSAYMSVGFHPLPIITGEWYELNPHWHSYRHGEYDVSVEEDYGGEAQFARESNGRREKLFSLSVMGEFRLGSVERLEHLASRIYLPPNNLDGRLTQFFSMLKEGQPDPSYLRSNLIRI